MSVKTEYKCDRCGHTQEKSEQMWSVGVVLIHGAGSSYTGSMTTMQKRQDWCRKCVEVYGLLPKNEAKPEEIKQQVTLEDLVREIVRQEVSDPHA